MPPKTLVRKNPTTKKTVKKLPSATKARLQKVRDQVYALDDRKAGMLAYKNTKSPPPLSIPKGVALSPCVYKYAKAIADPFSIEARGACVPTFPSRDSQKVNAYLRFEATIGSTGFGFFMWSPSTCSDLPQLWYSNASYGSSAIVPLSALNTLGTGVTLATIPNIPYTSTQLFVSSATSAGTQPIEARIVSAGFTCAYSGTTLNESGMVYCCAMPNHQNFALLPQVGSSYTATSTSTLSGLMETDVSLNNRQKCQCSTYAMNSTEQDFYNGTSGVNLSYYPFSMNDGQLNIAGAGTNASLTTYSVGPVNIGIPVLGACFTGVAGQTVHIEVMIHLEYAGIQVASVATPTPADLQGVALVQAAANIMSTIKNGVAKRLSPWEVMKRSLASVWTAVRPVALPVLENLVASIAI